MNLSKIGYHLAGLLIILVFFGCKEVPFKYEINTTSNPFKISPLTAVIQLNTEKPCSGTITVLGESPMEYSFNMQTNNLTFPILGLYPGRTNDIEIKMTQDGQTLSETIQIRTDKLPELFPDIKIDKIDRQKMEPGLHACDMHFANDGTFKSFPFIFDDQGEVRWYLDLSEAGDMVSPFQKLSNGNILATSKYMFVEYDMLGKPIHQSRLDPKYKTHHDVIEIPNGNLLVLVTKEQAPIEIKGQLYASTKDFVILYDRKNSKILKEWDLAKHLDITRDDLNVNKKFDWLHSNGLAYDPSDKSMIISGKNQGLIKISLADKLQWILAPNKNWGKAGRASNSFETEPYVLTATDKEGNPYDDEIQTGQKSDPSFDFTWGQHAPKLLPNGNIIAFDNGVLRNFQTKDTYSRAVEYKIDEKNKTVSQVWQYGKERGKSFYSTIVSDVDHLPTTNNILVTSGNLMNDDLKQAKIVEVDYPSGEEVFEATLNLKTLNGKGVVGWGQLDILYRSERMKLALK